MNFFEHQEKARKQSQWIIWAFIGVTLLIVLVIDLLVLMALATQGALNTGLGEMTELGWSALLYPSTWAQHSGPLLVSTLVTGGIIGLASLFKTAGLKSGGGKVARDMGATAVTPDTKDPLRRRLYNVVEEIAIASGTTVPEVYVMENESGINAFAAGYTVADAAIAVTQGTLEKLTRSELQGVVAHEFSHIFNGDMRINIRMMGVIFGIMVLAIIGRKFLHASSYRVRSSRDNNGSAIIAIGVGLMVVGYIGLFFARWMKSALSRQREYLADASAVQFTRDPDGIAGALKKIAAYSHSSYLKADSEEVSHMLFGTGYKSLMFATHPPLEDRISRLERGFEKGDISDIAKKLKETERREHLQAQRAAEEQAQGLNAQKKPGVFSAESMIENIGNPEFERIIAAAMLSSEISEPLNDAAHSIEWVPEVLFYCLLDDDPSIRERQQLAVVKGMGDISEQKLSHLINNNRPLSDEQRLPLLEKCFPTLKRRPIDDIDKILDTIDSLVTIDNHVDSFEYVLSRLVEKFMMEARNPSATRLHGKKKLTRCKNEASLVVSIVASHGQTDPKSKEAEAAYNAGLKILGFADLPYRINSDWQKSLDKAFTVLDQLLPSEKHTLIQALAATVADDGVLVTAEHEMLRVISSMIHVPLPILSKAELR